MSIAVNIQKTKIRLEESPYTYVRTTVMRTLLIPKQDYNKLLKMSISEISNYLGQTQYKKEIDELGVEFSGIELVEQALKKNFIHTIEKLKRISPKSFNYLIDAYLMKYDIENIKTMIRGKAAKLSFEELQKLLFPVGVLSITDLQTMWKKENTEEMVKSLPEPLNLFHEKYKRIDDKKLINVETSLDHFYFQQILEFAKRIPRQGALFKEFLFEIINTTNLLTYLRLKKEGLQNDEIKKHIFPTTSQRLLFQQLLKVNDYGKIKEIILKSKYKDTLGDMELMNNISLIPMEMKLSRYLLRKTLLFQHQNPLSVYVILSYLFAKEIEIQNIRRIVKAKHFGLEIEKTGMVIT